MDVEFLGVGASTAALNQKRLPVGQLWKGGIASITVGLKKRGYKKCALRCINYASIKGATYPLLAQLKDPYSDPNFDIQYNQRIDQLQLT